MSNSKGEKGEKIRRIVGAKEVQIILKKDYLNTIKCDILYMGEVLMNIVSYGYYYTYLSMDYFASDKLNVERNLL